MEESQARWPIRELADQVAAALAVGYAGAGNGRVRDVPDVRAIRWYATIGLLDKPADFRGRTALYGPRHRDQLVALKRCQAAGMPLADIQALLAGASSAKLAELAAPPRSPDTPIESAGPGTVRHDAAGDSADLMFWKKPPATVKESSTRRPKPAAGAAPEISFGISITEGVTVLLNGLHQPSAADVAAVRTSAQPLLRTLRSRGLVITTAIAEQSSQGDTP